VTRANVPACPLTLTAGDVHLRTWEPPDAAALVRACSDADVLRWTMLPDPYTAQVAREWVERAAPSRWASGQGFHFGVFDAGGGALLGAAGLGELADGAAEVGYWVTRQARGRGIATRAVTALCRWGFEELGLQRIGWQALVGNWPSRAVAERCGFRFEGTRRGGLVQRGQRFDCWSAGLLPADTPPPAARARRRPHPPAAVGPPGTMGTSRSS